MNDTPCPGKRDLEQLAVGLLPESELARLKEHLDECSRCGETIASLRVTDTLLDALQTQIAPLPQLESHRVEELMSWLGRLPQLTPPGSPPTRSEAPTRIWDSASRAVAAASADTELTDLLEPARAPDELGRLGNYRVLDILGQGGMGIVLRAEDMQLKRQIALKIMRPELAGNVAAGQRFIREAQATAAIDHDHIVPIYQTGAVRGVPFLAMPLLKGETLDNRLSRLGQLPIAEVLQIGRETAAGLATAHEHGLIHRDIKPANIWLEVKGQADSSSGGVAPFRVKILDLGLARAIHSHVDLTQHRSVLGTPAYMAPEQARGDRVDERADLFSLGCVLYRACSGELPFPGQDAMAILFALATKEPRPLAEKAPDIPRPLDDLIARLLAREPADRPRSAQSVIQSIAAIEQQLDRTEAVARPPVAPSAAPARGGLKRMLTVAIALALLLIGTWLSPQLIRIITDQGELVVVADDPAIELKIQQGALTVRDLAADEQYQITPKPGRQNIAAGEYRIQVASGSGLVVDTDEFKIERNGRQRVTVRLEPTRDNTTARAATSGPNQNATPHVPETTTKDLSRPFVLVSPAGEKENDYQHFAEALASAAPGQIIEVHGNGPFPVPDVIVSQRSMSIRAGAGFRPVFARSSTANNYVWINLLDCDLAIDGCDFQCAGAFALGGVGPRWRIQNCRFLQTGIEGGVIQYAGQQLTIQDTMILARGNGIYVLHVIQADRVDLINNLFSAAVDKSLFAGIPSQTRLQNNTIVQASGGLFIASDGAPPDTVRQVEASGNLFRRCSPLLVIPDKSVEWQGTNNIYASQGDWLMMGNESIRGLAEWNRRWSRPEEGSREWSDVRFEWQQVRHDTPQAAMNTWQRWATTLRPSPTEALNDRGPDWNLVGPGGGYVAALSAEGLPVAQDQLRPEASEAGPFVLWRDGKVVESFPTFHQAVDRWGEADTLEIRGDGPFDGATIPPSERPRVIRAAPGYLPVIRGQVTLNHPSPIAFEGIQFAQGITDASFTGELSRLKNCSLEFSPDTSLIVSSNGSQQPTIENCVIRLPLLLIVRGGHRLQLRNSVLTSAVVQADSTEQSQSRLELDRCLVWNPEMVFNEWHPSVFNSRAAIREDQLAIRAERSMFELGQGFILAPVAEFAPTWSESRNVYASALASKAASESSGIQELSADENGIHANSWLLDPRVWRLVHDPADAHSGELPGADVDRVAQ